LWDISVGSGFGISGWISVAGDSRHKTTFEGIAAPGFVDLESMRFFGHGWVLFAVMGNFEHGKKCKIEAKKYGMCRWASEQKYGAVSKSKSESDGGGGSGGGGDDGQGDLPFSDPQKFSARAVTSSQRNWLYAVSHRKPQKQCNSSMQSTSIELRDCSDSLQH
jgi:hypothetical protein